jgi:hypothetical protein
LLPSSLRLNIRLRTLHKLPRDLSSRLKFNSPLCAVEFPFREAFSSTCESCRTPAGFRAWVAFWNGPRPGIKPAGPRTLPQQFDGRKTFFVYRFSALQRKGADHPAWDFFQPWLAEDGRIKVRWRLAIRSKLLFLTGAS